MTIPYISFNEGDTCLDWMSMTEALAAGHLRPKATITDSFLYRGSDTLLNRAAWIDGLGLAVKSATVFPGNPEQGKPMVNGGVSLYSDTDGTLQAIIDFHLVTKWKTAGDSLLAARRLARPDSENILIIGAGTQGRALHSAYSALFPNARFALWNRTPASAHAMAAELPGMTVVQDLPQAVQGADIVTCATMSTQPVLHGEWLRPGQHIDLIGAYRPDMREADDTALKRAQIFVDSFDTTLDHIGELKIPLERGTLHRDDIIADYYSPEQFIRRSDDDITLFKNGGGAHLDLITSRHILDRWQNSQ